MPDKLAPIECARDCDHYEYSHDCGDENSSLEGASDGDLY